MGSFSLRRTAGTWLLMLFCCCAFSGHTLAAADAASDTAVDSGDTAWLMIAGALVLFMTTPGLALFYAGLVQSRNVLSILMQCLTLTALTSILWMVIGYSVAFSTTGMVAGELGWHRFIGGLDQALLRGIDAGSVTGTVPEIALVFFRMAFAVLATTLIIGAFAERIRFTAVLCFSAVWLLLVYAPVCHMTWAGPGALFYDWGVLDYSGGLVVHVTAGFSALVGCVIVGPRQGYPARLEPPHNVTLTMAGTAMLWVGWLGFNGGSGLAADGNAAMSLMVTHLSASAAALVWMAVEWIRLGKPGPLGAATGAVAGLAAITPAAGFVGPLGGLAIGFTAGLACFLFVTGVKRRLGFDDALDVFGVHGVAGMLGIVMTGIFAAGSWGGRLSGINIFSQLAVQLSAGVIAAVYSAAVTYLILKVIKLTIGLRISSKGESIGLDLAEHEERGYSLN